MIAGMEPRQQARPRRGRPLVPASAPRRRELLAGAAVTFLLANLVLSPLALVLAVACSAVSRISRWRLWWLLAPAAAGLAWALLTGPHQALAGLAAGPSAILGHFTAARAGHPSSPLAGIGGWLPRQAPLALPLGAAEAAVAGWLRWRRTDEWALPPPRPGLVAALRTAVAARAIRAGAVVTRTGCALGIVPATGGVAELSWAELSGGVLVTAAGEPAVALACRQVVHAALRCRKPVIVLDDEQAGLAAPLAAACRATGTPLLTADGAGVSPAAGASQLWRPGGRGHHQGGEPSPARHAGTGPGPAGALPGVVLSRVVSERLAVLLPAGSAELAAAACAILGALARDLRRIGVDGDALVWVPRAERLAVPALTALVRDGAAAGLAVLMGTTSPVAAAELAGVAGTLLTGPVGDPELAAALAARTGTRLLPPPTPAVPAAAASGLESRPAVPPPALMALGPAEFVLAVSTPRSRLVACGRLVPARLPRPAAAPCAAPGPPGAGAAQPAVAP